MAIKTVNVGSKAQLVLDGGMVNGKEKVLKKSFSNLKPEAENEAVHTTMTTLAGLQTKPLKGMRRVDEVSLVQE